MYIAGAAVGARQRHRRARPSARRGGGHGRGGGENDGAGTGESAGRMCWGARVGLFQWGGVWHQRCSEQWQVSVGVMRWHVVRAVHKGGRGRDVKTKVNCWNDWSCCNWSADDGLTSRCSVST